MGVIPVINYERTEQVAKSLASLDPDFYEEVYKKHPAYKVLEKLYMVNNSPRPLLVVGAAVSLIGYALGGEEEEYWGQLDNLLRNRSYRLESFSDTWFLVEEFLKQSISSRFRRIKQQRLKLFYSRGLAEYLWFEASSYYHEKPLIVWYKVAKHLSSRLFSKTIVGILRTMDMTAVIERGEHLSLEEEIIAVDKPVALLAYYSGIVDYDVSGLNNILVRPRYVRVIKNAWGLVANIMSRNMERPISLLVLEVFIKRITRVIEECKQSIATARACVAKWFKDMGVGEERARSLASQLVFRLP